MRVDGGCHCGRVTFEAEVDPASVSICHCTDCQSLTGSAFRVTTSAARDALHLTGAPPKIYEKMGDSGRIMRQHFCPDCGSPLFVIGKGDEDDGWGIRWGAIRQRRDLRPARQIWRRSAVDWLGEVRHLPGSDGDPN